MTEELHIHVVMKNGTVLNFTMPQKEVAKFMQGLMLDTEKGEQIESVQIENGSDDPFSNN